MLLQRVTITNFKVLQHLGRYTTDYLQSFRSAVFQFEEGLNWPNGAGKSNLLDAVLFALTADIKHLRVDSVRDLLHKGASEATVSLLFDNSKKAVVRHQEDFYELTAKITGDKLVTVYKLNGRQKQRKEVRSFLRDIGIDIEESSFVIYQHSVSDVVFSTPQRLADIIIGASRCKSWHEYSKEAQTEIARYEKAEKLINQNIQALEEALSEESRTMQAAIRLEKLDELISSTRRMIKTAELGEVLRSIQDTENRIAGALSQVEQTKEEESAIAEQLEELQRRQREETRALQAATDEAERLRRESEAIAATLATAEEEQVFEQRQQSLQLSSRADLDERLKKEEKALASVETSISAKKSELRTRYEDLSKLKTEIEHKEQLLAALESSPEAARETRLRQLQDLSSDVQKELLSLRHSAAENEARIQQLQQQHAKTFAELHSISDAITDAQTATDSAKRMEMEDGETRLKTLIVKREHLEADIAALSDEVAALERELQRYLWKVPSDAWHESIFSVFSFKGDFVKPYLHALQILAGGSVAVKVCKTSDAAVQLMQAYQQRHSCVRLWALDRMQRTDSARAQQCQAAFSEGQVTLPLDLLVFDAEFAPLLQRLFGNWVIVDCERTGERVVRDWELNAITRDGIQMKKGQLRGGYRPAQKNVFEQKLALDQYIARRSALESALAEITGEKVHRELEAQQRVRSLAQKKDALQTKLDEINGQLRVREASVARERELQLRLQEYKAETARLSAETAESALLRATAAELREATKKRDSLAALIEHSEEELLEFEAARTELSVSVAALRERLSLLEAAPENRGEGTAKTDLESLRGQLGAAKASSAAAEGKVKELTQSLRQLSASIRRLQAEQSSTRQRQSRHAAELKALERQSAELWERHSELVQGDEELASIPREGLQQYARKEELERQLRALQEERAALRVQKVSRRRDVSVRANDLSQLAQFKQQAEALRRSAEQLREGLKRGREKAARAIEMAYEVISTSFSQLFAAVVPGKAVRLARVAEELLLPLQRLPPLASQLTLSGAAVEEGLRFQLKGPASDEWRDALSELSGGQKSLLASAFLFGVAHYQRKNLYILDEVDAALDEINSQKLAQLCNICFSNSQVLAVSHHPTFQEEAHIWICVAKDKDESILSKVVRKK